MDPGQNVSSGAREETLSAALLAVPGIVTATSLIIVMLRMKAGYMM